MAASGKILRVAQSVGAGARKNIVPEAVRIPRNLVPDAHATESFANRWSQITGDSPIGQGEVRSFINRWGRVTGETSIGSSSQSIANRLSRVVGDVPEGISVEAENLKKSMNASWQANKRRGVSTKQSTYFNRNFSREIETGINTVVSRTKRDLNKASKKISDDIQRESKRAMSRWDGPNPGSADWHGPMPAINAQDVSRSLNATSVARSGIDPRALPAPSAQELNQVATPFGPPRPPRTPSVQEKNLYSQPVAIGAVGGAALGGISAYRNDDSILAGAFWGGVKGAAAGGAWGGLRYGGGIDKALRNPKFAGSEAYINARGKVSEQVRAIQKGMANMEEAGRVAARKR